MINTIIEDQRHILLVDDLPDNLKVLKGILSRQNYLLRIAINGELALRSASVDIPDLILLDIQMSGMDGFEVCKCLKADERTRNIPVIFFSGSNDLEDKIRAFSAGGVDFITKPFQEEEILARVKTHLDLRAMQKRMKEKNRKLRQAEHVLRKNEERLSTLVKLNQMKASSTQQELADFALEKAIHLTDSQIGYIHFVNPDQKSIQLFSWSKNTLKNCKTVKNAHYPIDLAGVWVDCVRTRNLVIHNDYQKLPGKKGLPDGHIPIKRHMSVPVFDGELIYAIAGVGNKVDPYDESDASQLSLFASSMWEVIQRRKVEEKLRENEERFRLTFDQSPIGAALVSLDRRFLRVNETFCKITGYSETELLELTYDQITHPENVETDFSLISQLISGKIDKLSHDKQYVRKDGSIVWANVSVGMMRDSAGNPMCRLPMIVDITERRQAEESLRMANEKLKTRVNEMSLLNSISRTMTSTGDFATALEISIRQIGDLLGAYGGSYVLLDEDSQDIKIIAHYATADDGIDLTDMVIPDMPVSSIIFEHGKTVIINDAQLNPLIAPIQDLIHQRGIQAMMIVPLKVPGKVIGAINISSDSRDHNFTAEDVNLVETIAGQLAGAIERASLYESAKTARTEAENANRAKNEFLANMSHEIRTPMNAVLGFLRMTMDDSGLSSSHKKNLNTAYDSANLLMSLINDILDVSKLENGKVKLDKHIFDLVRIIRKTLDVLNTGVREKGLALSLDVHPDISRFYIGDSLRLQQILLNLADNAIKFTEEGQVKVSLVPCEEENFLHFTVSDTGIGIAPERLSTIFDVFTQADSSTSRSYGGTGLGTTISKQLVELMGGQIWAESKEGRGSVFHFTVRMKATEQMSDNESEYKFEQSCSSRKWFKILLAEDVEFNIILVKEYLEREGHLVIVARNGHEAVEMFSQDEYDAVLMDIHMPEMDGLEATRKIREVENRTRQPEACKIPIIALTADIMNDEQDICRKAGMDAVVGKPIDFDKLCATLEQMISEEKGRNSEICKRKSCDFQSTDTQYPIPEIDGVDIQKGLKIWKDSDVYTSALIRFSRDYRNSADKISSLLEQGAMDSAFHIIHAIKGVSGNLSAQNIFVISSKINNAISENRQDDARSMIPSLEKAFDKFSTAISRLEEKERKEEKTEKKADLSLVTELLQNMLNAMDQYNPAAIEPFLSRLDDCMSSDLVDPVKKRVARFDFKGAKNETIKLASALGLELEILYG
ncbi:response regulator [Desulfobacterales bacterium HSG16]|nr:response regulator [Desulfobacterales bacterium HSG16]